MCNAKCRRIEVSGADVCIPQRSCGHIYVHRFDLSTRACTNGEASLVVQDGAIPGMRHAACRTRHICPCVEKAPALVA